MPFSASDRELLRAVKGVGPTVIARLEQLGYSDLAQLAAADVRDIVERTAMLLNSTCWKNSPQAKAAIEGAISAATRASNALAEPAPAHSQATWPTVSELAGLPNLGPKSALMLAAAGIDSLEQLTRLGSVAAYAMVKRSGARVSLNLLWALEGALTGKTWQAVAREDRASLLLALDAHGTGVRRA